MPTLEEGNALIVATELAERIPKTLSQTAKALYIVLVGAAVETAKGRGHVPSVSSVVMHVPLEIVAFRAGISRVSAWRHLPALRAAGLVDYRAHKAACRGKTHNSGTVWRIRLTPDYGAAARLSYQDLKHRWRDLDRDVRAGRTSHTALKRLKHTVVLESKFLGFESLLAWTLPPQHSKSPSAPVCFSMARRDLESVLDVKHAARDDRAAAVDEAAHALAVALRDASALNWYRRLLWQLLRRYDATGEDHSYSVYLMAVRARTDALEGFARKPGALFVSRLKAAPWYEDVLRGPPVRVGSKPLEA